MNAIEAARAPVDAILLQHDGDHTTLIASLERELRVDDLVEELPVGRCEDPRPQVDRLPRQP